MGVQLAISRQQTTILLQRWRFDLGTHFQNRLSKNFLSKKFLSHNLLLSIKRNLQ